VKICHVTSAHRNDDPRIFQKECKTLAAKGYQVFFVAPGESFIKNGVKVVGIKKKNFKGFLGKIERVLFYSKKIEKVARSLNCDVYHFHDPDMLKTAIRISKTGKKVIFDFHENYYDSILKNERTSIPKFVRKLTAKVYRRLELKACKRIYGCIVVNPEMMNIWKSKSNNILQITNFPLLTKCPVINDKKNNIIIFAGKNPMNYSQETFVKAMSFNPNIKYQIYGDISKENKNNLFSLSPNNIEFKGVVPFDKMYQAICQADIGMAVTSMFSEGDKNEGSIGNTKLFEYMMLGVPVICSDYVSWKKIVEGNECGICVNPNDISAIKAAINTILADKDLADKMGKNGRKAIEEKYNWSNDAEKLLSFYQRIENEIGE